MMEPLFVPKSRKYKGLVIWCNKCKMSVSEICKETGGPLKKCPRGDKHVFKSIIHQPGTSNGRRTKVHDTRIYSEAIKQSIEFEKEVKEKRYSNNDYVYSKKDTNKLVESNTLQLMDLTSRYYGWLNNENVPEHQKRIGVQNT